MELTEAEYNELEALIYQKNIEESREHLLRFTETTFKKFEASGFHKKFYEILNLFAKGKLKNLIVSMPPQNGKSEGSSRRLPAYIAGKRMDAKIALVCYAATKAQKFGREIMSVMREPEYKDIFPRVKYPERGYTGAKSNTNIERESINSTGSMKFVGVDGPLTGDSVDVLILDDLYKGWKDANSPVTQAAVWDWYVTVADTRLHNESQQLITFTRWSDQDLIAKLIDKGLVISFDGSQEIETAIEQLKPEQFLSINFPAIKEGPPTEFDPREEGEALWPNKHSKRKLEAARAKDPDKFDCLQQGNPTNKDGLMYTQAFKTYKALPELKIIKNYTDTADSGNDYLCSIVYGVPLGETDPHKYVIDLVYTQEGMEITEEKTAELLNRNNVNTAKIESNNGGRGFSRNVEKLANKGILIEPFYQGGNKEARIYSNSASVNRDIVFPEDWAIRWPMFYKHVTTFKKVFAANKFDDAPDVLTGIIEEEENKILTVTPNINAAELGLF